MGVTSPVIKDLRIVLLGKTGSGKSATGNTILRWEAFEARLSSKSVTNTCKKATGRFDGRTVSVIDTPGFFGTSTKADMLKSEVERCMELSFPGPHVFLLVLRLDVRFTEEEKATIQELTNTFGEEAGGHTLALFTRGDQTETTTVETYLEENPELKDVIEGCKAGYSVFDNKCTHNRSQVNDLFEKIDTLIESKGNYFTSRQFEEVKRKMAAKQWEDLGDNLNNLGNHLAVTAVAMSYKYPNAAVPCLLGAGATKAVAKLIKLTKKDPSSKNKTD